MTPSERLKSLFAGLYGSIVVLAVVPYGLVQTVPFTIVAVTVFLLALAAAFLMGAPRRGRWAFNAILLLLTLASLWILLQTLDFGSLTFVHPVWKEAHALAGASRAAISVAPADSRAALLQIALPAVTFLAGLIIADTDEQARLILKILASGAGLIAIFGLGQFLLYPDLILIEEKPTDRLSLTAVFVNHNTAATFLGLGFLLLATFLSETGRTVAGYSHSRARTTAFLVLAGLSLAVFTALMLSQSRGGVLATAIACLAYLPFLLRQWMTEGRSLFGPQTGAGRRKPMLVAAAVLAVLSILLVFASRTLFRVNVRGTEDARFCYWPDVARAISENWLTGTGFGTFRTVFSAYRSADCGIVGLFDRAHNSYLEGFLTLGIVSPVLMLAVFCIFGRIFRDGYRNRRRMQHYAGLGLAGTLLVATHAIVDFSLQIPGFAIFYAAFLGGITSLCYGAPTKLQARQ
ncbi:O-antigen ligase family protein [Rhizobium binxianense]